MTATAQIDQAVHDLIARAEFSMRHQTATLDPFDCLTTQECHILLLVAEGETNSSIAVKMFYTLGTVKNYVSSILMKLPASNRAEAAVIASKNNLQDYVRTK